jgi:hypothetical protein
MSASSDSLRLTDIAMQYCPLFNQNIKVSLRHWSGYGPESFSVKNKRGPHGPHPTWRRSMSRHDGSTDQGSLVNARTVDGGTLGAQEALSFDRRPLADMEKEKPLLHAERSYGVGPPLGAGGQASAAGGSDKQPVFSGDLFYPGGRVSESDFIAWAFSAAEKGSVKQLVILLRLNGINPKQLLKIQDELQSSVQEEFILKGEQELWLGLYEVVENMHDIDNGGAVDMACFRTVADDVLKLTLEGYADLIELRATATSNVTDLSEDMSLNVFRAAEKKSLLRSRFEKDSEEVSIVVLKLRRLLASHINILLQKIMQQPAAQKNTHASFLKFIEQKLTSLDMTMDDHSNKHIEIASRYVELANEYFPFYTRRLISFSVLQYSGYFDKNSIYRQGDVNTMRALAHASVDINHQNEVGDTLLHVATRCKGAATVEVLLDHGADYTLKNSLGLIPSDIAQEAAREEKQSPQACPIYLNLQAQELFDKSEVSKEIEVFFQRVSAHLNAYRRRLEGRENRHWLYKLLFLNMKTLRQRSRSLGRLHQQLEHCQYGRGAKIFQFILEAEALAQGARRGGFHRSSLHDSLQLEIDRFRRSRVVHKLIEDMNSYDESFECKHSSGGDRVMGLSSMLLHSGMFTATGGSGEVKECHSISAST